MSKRAEQGFVTAEATVALGIFGILVAGSMAFLGAGMEAAGDQQTDSWLASRARTCAMRIVDEIEEADPYDPEFAVSATELRFRAITGVTALGGRTYGNLVTYRLEPVPATAAYRLVRIVTDASGALVHQRMEMGDLTAPTDATAPSMLAFNAPFIDVQLVARGEASRAGGHVQVGVRERIRLRY